MHSEITSLPDIEHPFSLHLSLPASGHYDIPSSHSVGREEGGGEISQNLKKV